MNLSDEQLADIEKYANLFFSYKEIAILLKISIETFKSEVTDCYSEIYKSYQRGKLISECEIREEIIKMAKFGSAVAQIEALKLINNQKLNEITNA